MTEPEPVGRRRIVLVASITVLVLAVAGVAILLLTGDDEPDAANREQRSTGTRVVATGPTPSSVVTPAPAPAGDDVSAARQVADQAAEAITNQDIDAMKRLSCDPATVGTAEQFPPQAKAAVAADPEVSGTTATAQLDLTIGDSEPTTVLLPMEKRDGRWCVP